MFPEGAVVKPQTKQRGTSLTLLARGVDFREKVQVWREHKVKGGARAGKPGARAGPALSEKASRF